MDQDEASRKLTITIDADFLEVRSAIAQIIAEAKGEWPAETASQILKKIKEFETKENKEGK